MSRRREQCPSASSRSAARSRESTPGFGKETGLPLIQCTTCGQERIIELRAWTEKNYGRVFFKCPRYETGPRARCDFYFWQKDYLAKLVELGRIMVQQEAHEDWICEEHGDSRPIPVGRVTKSELEAKMDVLVRIVVGLVCAVCVVVVVGIMYLMK
ncbi:unnamed protein product [Urochloa decumbens]|uniref:GRF-type domain-containing protein n=1 Tax=Urochloa decumbens TaxID=240449 RepID=A0ABC8Z828_9POAL